MQHCEILIIDDDPAWLLTAARYFSCFKYKVSTANSCASGLEAFRAKRPDCILVDYQLGRGPDADVFCKTVRASEKLLRTPIVITSGLSTAEVCAYTVCQADAFILKGPFDRIIAVVEMVMRRVNWERGIMTLGDLRLERNTFSVFRNGKLAARLSPEQFALFSLLVCEKSKFVPEADIANQVFKAESDVVSAPAIKALVYRLRQGLGPQLGRRIKSKRNQGWIYVQPGRRVAKVVPV